MPTATARPSVSLETPLANILHPTDFSVEGMSAFHHALRLALSAQGRLDVVHVDQHRALAGHEWNAFPGVRRTLSDWGLIEAEAPESAVADRLNLRVVKTDIAAVDPTPAIAHHLVMHPADLVVLGTHGRDGLARLLHPSVSQALTRVASTPVLFVPQGAPGFIEAGTGEACLMNVLIPVDHTPAPDAAVRLAMALSRLLGQDPLFHLLHVGHRELPPANGFQTHHRVRSVYRKAPVVETILGVADELDADLIVMPTFGHDGVMDALRGSTTEQVLRRAHRPVLAVPA